MEGRGASAGNGGGENGTTGQSETGDGRLVSVYRTYVGEPESEREVYVGFGLFFAGVALGLAALALFLYSAGQPEGTDLFWTSREIALVFGLLALPAVGTSVPVLLPVGRRTTAASLLGVAICVVAIAWLTAVYPYDWSGEMDVTVITVYAVGLVLLTASTGSALVAQYLERMSGSAEAGSVGAAGDEVESENETVTDEQVAADIEEATSGSSLTWGGVEHEPDTERLELNMPDVVDEEGTDRTDLGPATETRSASGNVDEAVDGLRQLQGGERETARTDSPDDQVEALTEFRKQRAEDEDIETGVEPDRGPLGRLRAWLSEKI